MADAFVSGVSAIPVVRSLKDPNRDVAAQLAFEAIRDAGLKPTEIDGLVVTPPGFAGPPSFMWACQLGEYLGLETRVMGMTECGGATSTVAFRYAVDEVLSGRCRAVLVLAIDRRVEIGPGAEGSIQTELGPMLTEGLFLQTNLYGPFDGPYGIGAPIPYYAMSTQRYMHEHGLTERDLAQVAVVLRDHASKNPLAAYRKPITVDDVLASKPLSPPIKLLDCSPFTSGGAACVVTAEATARRGERKPVRILGIGEHHHPSHFAGVREPLTSFPGVARAAAEAFEAAGKSPKDVDVAEVYGVFSGTEIMAVEEIGFRPKGTGLELFRASNPRPVVDPSGGRLSLGHPAAATPTYELVEVVHHLRGDAGERQVEGARLGLFQSEHGMLNGAIVVLLETTA